MGKRDALYRRKTHQQEQKTSDNIIDTIVSEITEPTTPEPTSAPDPTTPEPIVPEPVKEVVKEELPEENNKPSKTPKAPKKEPIKKSSETPKVEKKASMEPEQELEENIKEENQEENKYSFSPKFTFVAKEKKLKEVHKNFLISKELNEKFKNLAKETGMSENQLFNEILEQLFN